jgi:outer membrane protein TolC
MDVPVGDLVNPIHDALNQIMGQPAFPTDLPNISTPFLREEEQETKLQVVQHLFRPDAYFNYKLRARLRSAEAAARDAFARDVVREVKVAYFTYLKTIKIVDLYERTELLLRENLRVSTSLFENGKATGDVVFRARAELSGLEQDRMEAEKNRDLARSYLNFLLNRPLETVVVAAQIDTVPPPIPGGPEAALSQAVAGRSEIRQLEHSIEAARNHVRLARSAYLPGLTLALDYGFEGEEYGFSEEDDFWMGSLVLEWTLFDGLQREARVGQAQAGRKALEAQLEELRQAIALQAKEAYDNVILAGRSMAAARDRLASARKTFEIVSRRYGEGMAPQIEYLDARTTMTQAETNLIVTTYDCWIRHAELERAMAAYPIRDHFED